MCFVAANSIEISLIASTNVCSKFAVLQLGIHLHIHTCPMRAEAWCTRGGRSGSRRGGGAGSGRRRVAPGGAKGDSQARTRSQTARSAHPRGPDGCPQESLQATTHTGHLILSLPLSFYLRYPTHTLQLSLFCFTHFEFIPISLNSLFSLF